LVHQLSTLTVLCTHLLHLLLPLQAQQQSIRITNTLKATVEGEVRPGSSDRYSINPNSFRLRPGDALELTVTLKLGTNFAQRQRAVEAGQRDPFYIKVGKETRSWAATSLSCV
jgi:hypothetical protein